MKILVGVDESPCSNAAVEFLAKLALPARTRVIVVSAVPFVAPVYSEASVMVGSASDTLLEDRIKMRQGTVSRVERELRAAGLVTQARVVDGDPGEAILRIARDEEVDLIVVGSHGRGGVARLVMGSVASHVVAHAPCSVLVAKARGVRA